jgi:hypothetical protein
MIRRWPWPPGFDEGSKLLATASGSTATGQAFAFVKLTHCLRISIIQAFIAVRIDLEVLQRQLIKRPFA